MKMFGNLPWLLLLCLGVMVLSSCGTVDTSTPMGGSIQGTSLSLSGATSTLAGTAGSSGSADGTGTSARFFDPNGVTTDRSNLYVADSGNHTIRKFVIATGVVTTLAGTAGSSGSTDGAGTSARFFDPNGITTDGTNLYVADSGNHTIRRVAAKAVTNMGATTTLAGSAGSSGSADGAGTSARFDLPSGITTDGAKLLVIDMGNNTVRAIE